MPRTSKSVPKVPTNNTVKLPEPLRTRVTRAMEADGFTVWAEFCRVALTDKCKAAEQSLLARDPVEHTRIYGHRRG